MYLDDRSHAELQAYVSQKMYGLPNTMDIQATMELKCQEKLAKEALCQFYAENYGITVAA